MRIGKRGPKVCKRMSAYKPQPRVAKWTCSKCGRVPIEEKERKSGEPRFDLVSFRSKAGLERHLMGEH